MPDRPITTGQKLKARREALGMTINELARRSGVSRMSIYYWENDVRDPSFFNLICIADVLDLSLDYLANRER